MKIARFIRKSLCLALSITILFAFTACANTVFEETESGILDTSSGTEYEFLTTEGTLRYFGELTFQGSVRGEKKFTKHLSSWFKTGLFSVENDESHNILIRRHPDSEWSSIYRKSSLPEFDFSVDNCIRLELISGGRDVIHLTCGDGITDKSEIAEFLTDIRSQQTEREADLFGLVTKPNGMLENCYTYASIYGFFEEEPNLAIRMSITSYNDLAYSVSIDGIDYVLPEEWLERLQNIKE